MLKGVTEDDVLALLHLEILFHVLTDHSELTILDVRELVDDQMRVVSAEVVEEDWNLIGHLPLEIALLMSFGDEPVSHVIVVADLRTSRILIALERLAADAAVSSIVKLQLLCG